MPNLYDQKSFSGQEEDGSKMKKWGWQEGDPQEPRDILEALGAKEQGQREVENRQGGYFRRFSPLIPFHLLCYMTSLSKVWDLSCIFGPAARLSDCWGVHTLLSTERLSANEQRHTNALSIKGSSKRASRSR